MSRVRYRPNPFAEEEIRAQPVHQRGMRKITKGAAASVRVVAPHKTGYYERKVRARGTRVVAADPFWHIVELGSANSPPYAPLRRGFRAAGIRLVVSPKPTRE